MKSVPTTKRNNYIDFLRGIAAVAIVLIHTCFWSGYYYVPELMQTLSLAIDVPFFFFLAGWSSTYANSFEKSIRSLLNVYKKYVMFLPFFVVILLFFGAFTGQYDGLTLRNLYGNLFFRNEVSHSLSGVMGSIWFMPVYFAVVPLGRFVTTKLYTGGYKGGLLLVSGLGLLYAYWTGSFFHVSVNTLFYLFFFFLGVVCKDIQIRRFRTVVLFCLADIGIMKLIGIYCGWDISNMQDMKFPNGYYGGPTIIYLLYSLLWICVTLWGKGKLTEIADDNAFCRIGRSAILFYFCQGISGSLLIFIAPKINLIWYIKLPIAFAINLTVTVLLVILLKWFYWFEGRLAAPLKRIISDTWRKQTE